LLIFQPQELTKQGKNACQQNGANFRFKAPKQVLKHGKGRSHDVHQPIRLLAVVYQDGGLLEANAML